MSALTLVRPPGRPLQIYLDSSDYSVLSDAMDNPSHPAAELFGKLCQWVDIGKIEIRFSSVHVIEIAHIEDTAKDAALRRAKCIARLSNGKCFRFWLEMPARECLNILTGRPIYDGLTSNTGEWHPDLSGEAQALQKMLMDGFKEILEKTATNRHQRRSIRRRFFPKDRLSKEGVELLQTGRDELLESLAQRFPLSERFFRDDLMLRFAAGGIDAIEIVDEMGIVFRDVERFVGWTYDTQDKDRKMTKWLRAHGRELGDTIAGVRAQIDALEVEDEQLSKFHGTIRTIAEQKVQELRISRLSQIRSEIGQLNLSNSPSDDEWRSLQELQLGCIPSLDAQVLAFCEHFRRNLQMRRKPKASDTGDILHLIHLPYCDFFRTDGDASETAKPIASIFKTMVVPKLRELPQRIDDVLNVSDLSS
jgi:hypothetical protein